MGQYHEIADKAVDNYGYITAAEATAMGIALKDVFEWEHSGRLEKVGRGVWRLAHCPCTDYDHYAESIALVGPKSWIWGESVLAMHNLALVNSPYVYVATARRVRRNLPEWLKIVKLPKDAALDDFNGIPCQNLAAVFVEHKKSLMLDRLLQGIKEATNQSLLTVDDMKVLRKEFNI